MSPAHVASVKALEVYINNLAPRGYRSLVLLLLDKVRILDGCGSVESTEQNAGRRRFVTLRYVTLR